MGATGCVMAVTIQHAVYPSPLRRRLIDQESEVVGRLCPKGLHEVSALEDEEPRASAAPHGSAGLELF